ncbi:MAG: hypothetical protein WCP65_00975 [Bacteroidota bacterium]
MTFTTTAYTQTFKRYSSENAENFAKRIYKEVGDLKYPIIETNKWDSSKLVIICFIGDNYTVLGYLLIPINDTIYKQVFIDSYSGNAATLGVEIKNVFFSNADKDKQNEIIVTTKHRSKSPRFADNLVEGFYYENHIYDNPNFYNPLDTLKQMTELSKKFSRGFEGRIYNKKTEKLVRKEKAEFKNEKNIRLKLKQMGY